MNVAGYIYSRSAGMIAAWLLGAALCGTAAATVPVQPKPSNSAAGSRPARQVRPNTAQPHATAKDGRHDAGSEAISKEAAPLIGRYEMALPAQGIPGSGAAAESQAAVEPAPPAKAVLRLNPDHSYEWLPSGGRPIHGHWVERSGGALLIQGQQGKSWLLRPYGEPHGEATVNLWDRNTVWYDGTPSK